MRWDRHGQLKPAGPAEWLGEPSPSFARICPFSPTARDERALAAHLFPAARYQDERVGPFEAAYVGHARDGFREEGSSGGLVSWIAAELLRQGLVEGVAHVVAVDDPEKEGRHFRYRISRDEAAVRAGAKSRYYPIELSGVLDEIRSVPGRYAVVGIPCFIKAVNLLRAEDERLSDRIAFTLGLYCGHMKSARMVESFAWQMGMKAEEVQRIDFRLKDPCRPANWYRAEITRRDGRREAQDWWHLVDGDWGAGFFQNSACDFCDDVVAETADISFGDAWVEPYSSDGRGTNVVIVRSPELHRLIKQGISEGRLDLTPVDADFVEQTQAAGFRQRREGLAYRLSWRRPGVRPAKRVEANSGGLPLRRKLIYRMRHHIAVWSHPVFDLARRLHWPALYLRWARTVVTVYQGLTYSRGPVGRMIDRLETATGRHG
ncbi:Coenzyme F420 hydrogenase/dehydrogenase, beta subunit C-terminal domain [Sphingosinicella humi]|uniref:Coenzyme F420 hydrogenase n=1 Tax=Allosphingosinicella humi TaxID=2068657 RepID=A0A2U2J6N6_9SPHN|nr:Coenzyme F420 hydrogenase/dehydrogenase, beta subunit C-terminal domain [Sphingosinicella humi]PWG03962.1 coenzyme F420 hydrogenase [Sphingosinicella humi]